MKKQNLLSGALCALLLYLSACSNEDELQTGISTEDVNSITMTAADFEYPTTRTDFEIGSSGAAFKWAANDTVGIFPNEGSQVYFPMTSGAGTNSATFTGGGWALKSSATYAAYYPFIGNMYLDQKKIPVSYTGQTQTGNGSTAHLGRYDFMAASATTAENGGVNFAFKHLGCLVQLKIDLLEEVAISNISVNYENDALFTNQGFIDLASETPQITTTSEEHKSNVISVKTNNLRIAPNETATIYFMMAPVNMENKNIDIIVTEDNGFTRTFQVTGKNFIAGKSYSYSMALSRENVVTANVTSVGTLSNVIYNAYVDGSRITDLKITGNLNGTDIKFLRQGFKNLINLDMSEANIVSGGNSYYTNEDNHAQTTSANTFPAYFMTESNLTNLESIILPNSVTTIPYGSFVDVFNDGERPISTYKLTKIVLGKSLTAINNISFACSMKSIHIPANVTTIGPAAFGYCPNLESITVNSSNNTFRSYDGALYCKESYNCCCPPAKASIEFPNDFSVGGIETRGFSDCIYLTNLILPEGVKWIGSSVFARCTSLKSLTIPSSVTSSNNPFHNNPAMKELHLKHTTPPSWYYTTGTTGLPTTCKLCVPYTKGWCNSNNTNISNWAKYFDFQYEY